MNITDVIIAACGLLAGIGIGWVLLSSRLAAVQAYSRSLKEQIAALNSDLDQAARERTEFHERAISAEADKRAIEARLKDQQEQLRMEFKNTSNALFEDMSKKFSANSEKQLGDLLNPMRERLNDFKKLVEDKFGQQGKEQHTLKAEIEKIVLQTDSLTKALRGDVKAQGNWGEVMLEKILEESGLRRGVDYVAQGSDMSLSGAEGNRLRPDYIVNLPENKHIIIDSKVSITAYDRYCDGGDEMHLKEFLRSMKNHVNGLEQKRYQDLDKLDTPEFVLMFVPIEGAYSLALQHDRELHSYAWAKRIAIVCPTTLFVTLQTIASIWRREQLNNNVQEIARQGGALYDKFVGFVEDMDSIGKQVGKLQQTYDGAMNKLKSGTGNLIGRVEKLKQLGAKTTKSLPKSDDSDDKVVMISELANSEGN